jgi:hypothetical protein
LPKNTRFEDSEFDMEFSGAGNKKLVVNALRDMDSGKLPHEFCWPRRKSRDEDSPWQPRDEARFCGTETRRVCLALAAMK